MPLIFRSIISSLQSQYTFWGQAKIEIVLGLLILIYAIQVHANPPVKIQKPAPNQTSEFKITKKVPSPIVFPDDLWQRSSSWLIKQHNQWSDLIGNTGKRLDDFFSGNDVESQINKSFIRLSLESRFSKQGKIKISPSIHFRLDLPTLQKRLKLVIENNPSEYKSLKETNTPQSIDNVSLPSNTFLGAFRFLTNQEYYWNASTSVGIKIHANPDPFWRAQAYRHWRPDQSSWLIRFHSSIYYFRSNGFGEKNQLFFERPFSTGYYFRTKTESKWLRLERKMEYAQVFSLQKELSNIRAIKYEAGILATNRPSTQATDYFLDILYRRKLYQNWFFYEVTPELLFSKSEKFKPSPLLFIRLEVIFFKKGS